MNIPKLSIVIPVYNVEDYLDRCIKSILSQDFQDFELILINDGSGDSSPQICEHYAISDRRITVYHKVNGGVSSARNLGLKHAKGEWIYFVDSDDSLVPNCLSKLMLNLGDSDILQFGYEKIVNENVILSTAPKCTASFSGIDDFNFESSFKTFTLWTHLIKSSMIHNYNITFSEGVKYGEDLEFVIKALLVSKNISIISAICYQYYERDGSAMQMKKNYVQALDHLKVAANLIEFSQSNKINKSIFLIDRITYMIKSFFSYSASVDIKLLDLKLVERDYANFYDKYKNIGYIKPFVLKVSRYTPNLYIKILRMVIRFYNGK